MEWQEEQKVERDILPALDEIGTPHTQLFLTIELTLRRRYVENPS